MDKLTSWGGARPGAGRKKGGKNSTPSFKVAVIEEAAAENLSPLDYLLKLMRDPSADPVRRDKAAIAAIPFIHVKAGDVGKKATAQEKAKVAGRGKFAPSRPPGIALVEK